MLACPGMTLLAGPAAVQNIPRDAVAANELCNRPVYDRRLSAGAQPSAAANLIIELPTASSKREPTNYKQYGCRERFYRFLVDS